MATKTEIKVTPEMLQAVLNSMSPEQLQTAAKERLTASLGPKIEEYKTTDERLTALRIEINGIDPEWVPPSLDDKIVSLCSTGKKTATEIRSHFRVRGVQYGTIKLALKRLADNAKADENRLTFDKKTEIFSVIEPKG